MRVLTTNELQCVGGSGDYCGPPGNTWIPDNPLGYDFSLACQAHDLNYSPGSTMTRAQADSQFLNDMMTICNKNYDDALLCQVASLFYYAAVSVFGSSNYQAGVSSGGSNNPNGVFNGSSMSGATVVYVGADAAGCIGDYFDVPSAVDDFMNYA